ncbi:hypothetical protein Q8F55_001770 [Vanrija albida]|uniref:Ornithine decarboxylase antizyme n=1 Tax=Vanrija albida TaxID=181172 RepID=A0ABR3Q8M2_9TREE
MRTTSHDTDSAWLFAAAPTQARNALALARVAGLDYIYTDPALGAAQGGYCTLATGARHRGAKGSFPPAQTNNNPYPAAVLTPPSSLGSSAAVRMPPRPPVSLPSPPGSADAPHSFSAISPASTMSTASSCDAILPLLSSVFPYAASSVASSSSVLEIVTPPDVVLNGFVSDETSGVGRIVFVHLPPTGASAPQPDYLAPHFSDVLRPHDPRRRHPSPPPQASSGAALDIRDSLTALLDLADTLEAAELILILDKDERQPEPLAELMHALMYVGGQPVRPGAPVGEWDWDARRWALVSIEL